MSTFGDTPFSVLHVCTGNIGRSPMAQHIMGALVAKRLSKQSSQFTVASAGTWGCEGSGMEPFARLALAGSGLGISEGDLESFRARELTVDMLTDVDLVLTATAEHRAVVVGMAPGAVRRAFTLKEFARIAGTLDTTDTATDQLRDRAIENVRVASQLRGMAPRTTAGEDDIEDPLGAPLAIYKQRAVEIHAATLQALGLLLSVRH